MFTILLLSIVTGAAWAREHSPTSNPITAVDIQPAGSDLLNLLHSHQFDVLDHQLNTMQLNYEKDTERELAVSLAFNWFDLADPGLENLFQEWLKIYPESYAANLALGIYYMAMAAQWRGTKYINETHPWRIENMDRYLKKAVTQLEKSLHMTQKPTVSYAKLIGAARYHGDDKASNHWLTEALNRDPYCVKPRHAYLRTLEPRWGGSYEAMRKFMEDTRKAEHPKLAKAARLIEGWIHFDKGYQKHIEGNYVAALDEYQNAIDIEDDSWFRSTRAEVYQVVGQTDLAIADLNRALELDSQLMKALYMRGITLLDKRQTVEALKDLHMAAEHGNMSAVKKLGDIYTTGDLGVPLKVEEGMKWWAKAAYFWDEYACFALGKTYERGLGVQVDQTAAVRYYRIAADQGYGPAVNDLGMMLWYGQGTPANREEAIQLWITGAKKNIWQSKHNLQFFLSPLERIKLLLYHPQLFFVDKNFMWLGIALILVFMLVVILLVIVSMRLAKKRMRHKNNVNNEEKMNDVSPLSPQLPRRKRPKLVWVITIFYFVSAGWTLFSFLLIYSGVIPLNEAQTAYFKSQTILDILFTIVIGLLNLSGAIFLFLLRRTAYYLFLSAFALGLLMTSYHIIFRKWLDAIGVPGLIGAIIGWGISIAIIMYTRKLSKAGILKK